MVVIQDTRKEGAIAGLDTLPAPVVAYLDSLYMPNRFPKCVEMLSRIPKGGAKIASFNPREKQMLNELIQHELIRKSKQNYLIWEQQSKYNFKSTGCWPKKNPFPNILFIEITVTGWWESTKKDDE